MNYEQGEQPAEETLKEGDGKVSPEETKIEDWAQADGGSHAGLDAPNLVPFFLQTDEGKKWLGDKVASRVCEDFKSAWDNSEEYREKRKEMYRLLTGFLKKKTFPYDGCANAHTPLMFERHLRLVANVYAEIFMDRELIFTVKPTGPDDYERAELLTLHGNWQLRNELTDFLPQMQAGLQEFFGPGSVFCYSWRDTRLNRNRHDVLTCEDFVFPYVHVTWMVDMSDVPFKVRILRKYRNELEDLRDSGEWSQVETILDKGPPGWDFLDTKVREVGAKHEGIVAPEASKSSPFVLYDWHGWLRMPGEEKQRPMCAIVDAQNKTVVRLFVREEEDWRDRARYDGEAAELQQYTDDFEAFHQVEEMRVQLQQKLQDPTTDPEESGMINQALQADQLKEPTPPGWMQEGAQEPQPVKRIPLELFSHGRCVSNPMGAMGLSFGSQLADRNKLADEALNRFYDSATLANVWSIAVPEGLDFGSSSIATQPGKIFRVKGAAAERLRESIVELKAQPANQQLMDMVRYAEETADAAVAAPGVLSGEPGKSGETFRGLATRKESASKQLSAAGINFLAFIDQILKNNARLNRIFMLEDEPLKVGNHFMEARKATLDENGKPKPEIRVGRDLYRQDYAITFTADVRFASQAQRVSEADEVLSMVTNIPQLQNDIPLVYAAVAEALRARGKTSLIPMLGPPPPAPTTTLGMPPPQPQMPPGGTQPGPGGPPGPNGQPPGPQGGPPRPGGPPPGPQQGPPRPQAAPGPIQGPRPQGAG